MFYIMNILPDLKLMSFNQFEISKGLNLNKSCEWLISNR